MSSSPQFPRIPRGQRTLTTRQTKLVYNLSKGMTLEQAGIASGYSKRSAAQCAFQALEAIREKMPQILDKAGLTDYALVERYLKPALEAQETEFAKFEGQITDSRDVIAWGPRLQALDMAFNLKGSYAPKETHNLVAGIVQLNVQEVKSAEDTLRILQATED